MALAVTIADNADGTGFTATLSGTGGASASVYYTPADRPWPGDAWILGGTRVGDGTLVVAVPKRFYFAYAGISVEITPPDRFAVTDGRAEPHTVIQDALVALLKMLNLPSQVDYQMCRTPNAAGWVGVNVYNQLSEDVTERRYPCLTVTVGDEQENLEKGTNCQDDVVYPCRVMLYDTPIKTNRGDREWVQYCRSKVSKALRYQHSLGVPSLVQCRVRYNRIVAPRLDTASGNFGATFEGFAGGFLIECVNRENRGLGA